MNGTKPRFTVGIGPHWRTGSSITKTNIACILALAPTALAGAIAHSFGSRAAEMNAALGPIHPVLKTLVVEMGVDTGTLWFLGILGTVGFGMGLFRLAVDTPPALKDDFAYTQGSFFWIVNNTFFQYYSILILLVCAAVMYVVSYMSEEPDYAKISGLTYGTVTAEDRAESRASWNKWDVIASGAVIAAILAAYLYFTG